MGFRAYQTCVRRSNPTLVFVGPAMGIQVVPKAIARSKGDARVRGSTNHNHIAAGAVEGAVVCDR